MMGVLLQVLLWIFLFIIILSIVAACIPRSRHWIKEKGNHIAIWRPGTVAQALRSQAGSLVLPEIAIPSASPLAVSFNRPDTQTEVHVTKSGNYRVTYSALLVWSGEAVVATAVQGVHDSTTALVDGSQQQTQSLNPAVQPLSYSFLASFTRGTRLSLLVQSSVDGAVVIPASSTATLLTPTVLASLTISEV